jgi:hypothetical protein
MGGEARAAVSIGRGTMRSTFVKAKTFDRKFDANKSITGQLDLGKARRAGTETKRVNVDFPAWMVGSLDREARRMGVTRQSLIKLWLADKLGDPAASSKR